MKEFIKIILENKPLFIEGKVFSKTTFPENGFFEQTVMRIKILPHPF